MRRGVTLLELMLALALVLALAAITWPALVATGEHRALSNAADAVEKQLLLARAHAMIERTAVEVRFDAAARAFTVRELVPGAVAGAGESAQPSDTETDSHGADDGTTAASDAAIIKLDWAVLELDPRIKASATPPLDATGATDASGFADAVAREMAERQAMLEDLQSGESLQESVVVAFFLPDGSAPVSSAIWLTSEDGRSLRIEVGAWTGLPRISIWPVPRDAEDAVSDDGAASEDDGADARNEARSTREDSRRRSTPGASSKERDADDEADEEQKR